MVMFNFRKSAILVINIFMKEELINNTIIMVYFMKTIHINVKNLSFPHQLFTIIKKVIILQS